MARPEGLEPPAYRFEACRSIQLSYGRAPKDLSFLHSRFQHASAIADALNACVRMC